MSGTLHTLPEWRRPIGSLDYALSDICEREHNSLAEAVYDLLSVPMARSELLIEILDEWGSCTDGELGSALLRPRRAGRVRRRGDAYMRAEAA